MTLDDADIRLVLDAWPADDAGLPASVRAAFDAWDALRMPAINDAIRTLNDDAAVGFLTPRGGGFNKKHKCRTLAVHSVAAPGGGVTPLPAELRTLLPAGGGRRGVCKTEGFGRPAGGGPVDDSQPGPTAGGD